MMEFNYKKSLAILFVVCILLFSLITGHAIAISFCGLGVPCFEKRSSWDTPIPTNPVLFSNSDAHVADLAYYMNIFAFNRYDWGHPVWTATASTPKVTVQMKSPTDTCGSAAIQYGWNVVPIPPEAKSAGMNEWCAGSTDDGKSSKNNKDLVMTILSADGKWAWDLYKASKCSTTWRANCVRKRARTAAAAAEDPNYTWGGDGVGDVKVSGSAYTQDDLKGNVTSCTSSRLSGLVTYNDYLSGEINHAISFAYDGQKAGTSWQYYPCLSYRSGYVTRPYAWHYGMRLQLKPTVDCNQSGSGWNNFMRMVCRALKTYGAILVESTGQSTEFYIESTYGKSNFWAGIADIGGFPVPIDPKYWQVVKPVCDDCSVCPNCIKSVPASPIMNP